jgi:multiple sugar transport system substrate-binding protein
MNRRTAPAVVAGVAAVALALAGCSSGSATDAKSGGAIDGKGKTLDVFIGANTTFPTQQKQWFQTISDDFTKKTGAKVQFETFASANDELTKIQTSVVSGTGPDVYTLGTTFTPTAYATGAFQKLDDATWAKVGGRDRFVPATLGLSGPDQKDQVGIPFASRPFVMAYNPDLLKAAGIDKPATTWDELTSQAKKLTTGDQYGLAVAYADSFDPWKFIWAMSIQNGNPLVKGKKADLDDPVVKKAYQTYFDWVGKDGVVDPAATGWKNPQAVSAFAAGKAAYLPMVSSGSKVTLDASPLAGKYKYAVMPTVAPGETKVPSDGKPAASIISGDNIVVAQYSKNKDLALALVEMLTDEKHQELYTKTFGDLPTNAAAAKKIEDGNEALAPILDAGSKSVGTPFSGAWGEIQLALVNVVVQAIPDLSNGDVSSASIDDALKQAQSTAQAALDKVK